MSYYQDRSVYGATAALRANTHYANSTATRTAPWPPLLEPSRHNYIPTPASYASAWHPANLTCQSEYNSHPRSTTHAPTPPSLLGALGFSTPPPPPPRSVPQHPQTRPVSRASAYSAAPYAAATSPGSFSVSSASTSTAPPASPPPLLPLPIHSAAVSVAVKQEQPDDDGFIVDAPPAPSAPSALAHALACAPPTEVPLRATQASARMRRMMGVFRLNPFAIHGNGRGKVAGAAAPGAASWAGGEARPLDEPPQIFEFQVALERPLVPEMEVDEEEDGKFEGKEVKHENEYGFGFGPAPELDASLLRAFSPEYEMEPEVPSEPEWELAYPPTPAPAFDPVAAYPRTLYSHSQPAYHTPTRSTPAQNHLKTRPYDALPHGPMPRRWSLPAHAHDPVTSPFLM